MVFNQKIECDSAGDLCVKIRDKKRILLLCNYVKDHCAETILEHIQAFQEYSEHHVTTVNMFGVLPADLDLETFDVLIIHYTICIGRGKYLYFDTKQAIRNFNGQKIVFIQDDYRWINSTVTNCLYMKIDNIFGLADQSIVHKIYPKILTSTCKVETVLTGYVNDAMYDIILPSYSERTVDVSYRARKVPFWLGEHTLQKWQIAEKFLQDPNTSQLNCNISTKEEDRLYGDKWLHLLQTSKAVLGTESGVDFCDFTGDIQNKTEAYMQKKPNASFLDVKRDILDYYPDQNIMMNVLSPRIFESIACKTLLILYPGHYNGVITPWKHYVPLEPDHSNIEEVIKILRSPERAEEIISNAYHDVLRNPQYHYRAMVHQVDKAVNQEKCVKILTTEETHTQSFTKKRDLEHKKLFIDYIYPFIGKLFLILDSNTVYVILSRNYAPNGAASRFVWMLGKLIRMVKKVDHPLFSSFIKMSRKLLQPVISLVKNKIRSVYIYYIILFIIKDKFVKSKWAFVQVSGKPDTLVLFYSLCHEQDSAAASDFNSDTQQLLEKLRSYPSYKKVNIEIKYSTLCRNFIEGLGSLESLKSSSKKYQIYVSHIEKLIAD